MLLDRHYLRVWKRQLCQRLNDFFKKIARGSYIGYTHRWIAHALKGS